MRVASAICCGLIQRSLKTSPKAGSRAKEAPAIYLESSRRGSLTMLMGWT